MASPSCCKAKGGSLVQQQIFEWAQRANEQLWDVLTFVLIGAGIYFSLRLGFPQLTRLGEGFQKTFGGVFKRKAKDEGGMSSFQALATSVAAQVGTGNIAGVATAILAGGPGAIFWMWVSAFFGMGTIFCEAVLAQHFRDRRQGELVGGPAFYIKKGIAGPLGKFLGAFFSVAIILALGFIGNLVQSNSITSAIVEVAPAIPPLLIGVVIAVLAALVFFGGMKRIASFASLVVPIMAAIYLLGCLVIMVKYADQLLPTLGLIFRSAFTGHAAVGGIMGASVKMAVQKGVARGLLSNEAGMGSTPHAHAVAAVKHPAEQGLTALVGVFIDTVLVCTATALVILLTGAYMDPGLKGVAVTQEAFELAFGPHGDVFLAICLAFFAFTTIVGWYYFGEANIRFLFGPRGLQPYRFLVCVFIVLGALGEVDLVWTLADLFNGVMVLPNMIALLLLSGLSVKILKDYESCQAKKELSYDYPVK